MRGDHVIVVVGGGSDRTGSEEVFLTEEGGGRWWCPGRLASGRSSQWSAGDIERRQDGIVVLGHYCGGREDYR